MILNKPKFWDKNQISIWSILLMPITIIIILFNYFKFKKYKKLNFSIPIICVGNIYIGGTGKTPLAIEIYKILKSLNKKPAFIRKFYQNHNDEHSMLRKFGKVFLNKERKIAPKWMPFGYLCPRFGHLGAHWEARGAKRACRRRPRAILWTSRKH